MTFVSYPTGGSASGNYTPNRALSSDRSVGMACAILWSMTTTQTFQAALAARNALTREARRLLGWITARDGLTVERSGETISALRVSFAASDVRALVRLGCVTAEKTGESRGTLRATALGRVVYDVNASIEEDEAERRSS